jgi:two-component system phosphate regulon sensor histidine kinase PhoR
VRWNPRLFAPFFAPYLIAVATVAVSLAIYADRSVEGAHIRAVGEALLREARLTANALPWDLRGTEFDRHCRQLAADAALRVTVIQPDGTVACDSQAVALNMENHLYRPEVQAALKRGDGQSVRQSSTTGQRLLYRAVLQRRGNEQRVVRIAVSLSEVGSGRQRTRAVLAVILGLAVLLGLWPAARLSRQLSRRINHLIQFSQTLAADRLPDRLAPERADELGRLEGNLAAMGRAVAERLRVTRDEESKLRAVLASMAEGVLVISTRGDLVLLNERAREIFGLDASQDYGGQPLVAICRDPELQHLVRDTIRMTHRDAKLSREISIGGESPRVLAVNAVPVQGDGAPLGFVLVFHEITELKKLEAVRRDFVANVSHELRTPLTAIRGYAETLLGGALDQPENARRFLGVIERNAERLTRLIDDLLALSDLELGRLGLQRTAVPVRGAVEAAFEVVGDKARRGGVQLRHEEPPDLLPIDGDGDRVEQVLVNLIDNAVKYTPSGGTVTVTASSNVNGERANGAAPARGGAATPFVEIAVSDTGIGIPSQDLPRLTERFYRVDKARSRELGGTGLGLAIVKHIVQAHGGWMRIDSQLGKGTTVRVAFPAAERREA